MNRIVSSSLVILALTGSAFAQTGTEKKTPAPAPKPAAQPAAAKPEANAQPSEAEMMELYMKAATPGEGHKRLSVFEGEWTAKITSYEGPEPMTMTGTGTNTWIMDGRFLKQDYKGDMMGMPFVGLGYWGYDNVSKKYVGTWMDSMGTGIMVTEGTYDAATKSFTMHGSYNDPMTGQPKKVREVTTVTGINTHTLEFYSPGPDGKEMKNMLIEYTRSTGAAAEQPKK